MYHPQPTSLSQPMGTRHPLSYDRCADAMSFNGFDLAETYPYELDAGVSRIVSNVQAYGMRVNARRGPVPTSHPVRYENKESNALV